MRLRRFRIPRCFIVLAIGMVALPLTQAAAQGTATGRLTGRVIDRSTGRPITSARVMVVGIPGVVETDLDGRYRTPAIPVGIVSVRAAYIGYSPQQVDSVRLIANQAVTVDFALNAAAVELAEISVETQIPRTQASDAGLLAVQQAAAAASDGISAEAISKTPDSDAGDAVARITGVTVVDDKTAVVRGLGERYTNTLLNGVETASPEPLKRTVPLDVFAASLLESIVTTKSATPDRPGDFAGGSLEIKTKDFPENFGGSVRLSQKVNSQATFQSAMIGPRSTLDLFGFDDGRRDPPKIFPLFSDNAAPTLGSPQAIRAEQFGEAIRNVWSPKPRSALPELGLGFNVGGQIAAGSSTPVGYIASVNYSTGTSVIRNRIYRLVGGGQVVTNAVDNRTNEDETTVDWGGIANVAVRLGTNTKIGWKNFYTRTAEENFLRTRSYVPEFGGDVTGADGRIWQVRYIEKSTLQTQVSGEHRLGFLGGTRLEWKGTYSRATRDEPENRFLRFTVSPDGLYLDQNNNQFQFRFLEDVSYVGQADIGIPIGQEALFKFGGLYRDRSRDFRARLIRTTGVVNGPPIPIPANLEPEEIFSPELVGSVVSFKNGGEAANSYAADDDLTALYVMADLGPLRWLRIVGGLRVEDWRLNVFTSDRNAPIDPYRRNRDYLWSANLTLLLSDRVNLRLAGFRSVARPDPRELTPEVYFPVGGECGLKGDNRVQRASVINGDAKLEFFPALGELVSVSGYYKTFDMPLLTTVGATSNGCRVSYANGKSAIVYGGEFEVRKRLAGPLSANLNFSYVHSEATLDSAFAFALAGAVKPQLQGQSPYIINAGLNYDDPDLRLGVSVLFNYFGDRVYQYGASGVSGGTVNVVADQIEEARGTLDAKITKGFGRVTFSVAGRNLTDEPVTVTQRTASGATIPVVHYRRGYDVTLGVSSEF
jgi:hypothetical protein